MRHVHERRAATILHHLARSQEQDGPWLLPANVCPIVPLALMKADRPFELIDIDDTLCMSTDLLRQRLDEAPRPAAVLWVRTYGLATDRSELFHEIRSHAPDALIIDDRCPSKPELDPPTDPSIDAAVYSTGYAKVLDLGGGGYAWLSDRVGYDRFELPYERADLDALTERYKRALSTRSRMTEADGNWLESAAAEEPWETYLERIREALPDALAHKNELNAIYRGAIPDGAQLGAAYEDWRFHVRLPEKERLLRALFDDGLFASSHYDNLAGIFTAGAPEDAPRAAAEHARIVNLFNDRYYTVEQARRTAELVRAHLRASR